jgi:hypothetical protein
MSKGRQRAQQLRACSKKSVQQGHRLFGERSVHFVREYGKWARTPLAAFFNMPTRENSQLSKDKIN